MRDRRSPVRAAVVLVLLATAAPPIAAQQAPAAPAALPPAPHASTTWLTPRAGWYSEPSIAVDPKNPAHLVAAWQADAHIAFSRDSGRTWQDADGVAPPDYRVSGDVSVTFDAHGHAILCYIAFDRLGTTDYWAHGATRNGIFTRRSLDGGRTWEAADVPVIAHPTEPGIPFEDKPYVVADDSHSRFAGNLYVGWTQFTLDSSVILFARSTDGGASWSAPNRISTHAGLPRDDNGNVEGFTGAVGAHGTLYVAWADGNTIAFTRSTDGGRTFAPSHPIVHTAPPYFKVADVERANGFPQLGIDPRTGRLFVTWSDYRNGDIDVFSATSTDGGATWSPAARVNDDPVHDGADQFFQWLAVDPVSGAANVVFYDRRADPANRETRVALARSTDGGRTWTNYAWTDTPFYGQDAFLGDYTGIAAYGGRVYGIWTEQATPDERDRAFPGQPHSMVRVGMADY
jgi:hypothetical protein